MQGASVTSFCDTLPKSRPASCPRPRLPTTSISIESRRTTSMTVSAGSSPVETEGEVDLVPGADLAGEGNRLAVGLRLGGDRADGTRLRGAGDLPATPCNRGGNQDQGRGQHHGPESAGALGGPRGVDAHGSLLRKGHRPARPCGAQRHRHGAPLDRRARPLRAVRNPRRAGWRSRTPALPSGRSDHRPTRAPPAR